MHRRRRHGGCAVAAALLLAACGAGQGPGEPPSSPPPTPTHQEPGTPAPPPQEGPSTDPGDGLGGAELPTGTEEVAAAVRDLADHLGVDPADISVIRHESVTWRDGALGCPQPGTSYSQALVPGTRLLLEAGGAEYAYHAGTGTELTRCDDPQAPAPDGVD